MLNLFYKRYNITEKFQIFQTNWHCGGTTYHNNSNLNRFKTNFLRLLTLANKRYI